MTLDKRSVLAWINATNDAYIHPRGCVGMLKKLPGVPDPISKAIDKAIEQADTLYQHEMRRVTA